MFKGFIIIFRHKVPSNINKSINPEYIWIIKVKRSIKGTKPYNDFFTFEAKIYKLAYYFQ